MMDGHLPKMNDRIRLKLLVAVGATLVAACLVTIAASSGAARYEITVYDGYSMAFWAALLAALFVGQVVVVESARGESVHRYWKWGLALVLAVNAVLMLIPVVRYHMFARGDVLTFIGMIEGIRELGHVPRSNYYPNIHLLTLALSYVTGLDVRLLVNVVPVIGSLFYVVALYELLAVVFDDERKVLFVLPFGALLLFKGENMLFTPSVFDFMLLPFVLYLLFRIQAGGAYERYRFAFVVVLVSVVFFHPLTTLFFIGVFVLLKGALLAGRWLGERDVGRERTTVIAASVAFIVFFSWYYTFESIVGSTAIVLVHLLGISPGAPQYSHITGVLARTSPELSDLALVGIYKYGIIAPVLTMGLVFLGYHGFLYLKGRKSYNAVEAFVGAIFVVFTVGAVFAFFVDISFGKARFLRYVRFAGTILIGLGFFELFRRADPTVARRYLRPALFVTLFVLAFFSVFALYGSPLSNSSSSQTTEGEVEGMEWLFENRGHSMVIDELGISHYRFYTYLHDTKIPAENIRRARYGTAAPPHFAYGNITNEEPINRRYLVINRLGRIKNARFFPGYQQFWQHKPADFRRIENDPSFAHVYDGGGLDTYVVHDVGNRTASSSPEESLTG